MGIIAIEVIEMILAVLGLNRLLGLSLSKRYMNYVIGLIIFIFAVVLMNYDINNQVYYSVFAEIIIVLIIFNEKIYRKILLFLNFYVFIGVMTEILLISINFIFHLEINKIQSTYMFKIIVNILFIGIVILVSRLIKQANIKQIDWYYFLLITFIMACWIGVFEYIILIEEHQRKGSKSNIVILMILSGQLLTIITIIIALYHDIKSKYKEEKIALHQEMYKIKMEHDKVIYDNELKTMKFNHDIKAYMRCMQSLIHQENFDGLIKYIDQVGIKIEELPINNIFSGNDIVDAVINQFINETRSANIAIITKENIPNIINMLEIDLCTIFYNLIMNAIEACKKIDRNSIKEITIEIQNINNALNFNFTNPVHLPVEIEILGNGTTKEDKVRHGFGLQIVKEIVIKYNGNIQFINNNDIFKVDVILHDVLE